MADTDKVYIGIEPCGCVTAAMVAGYESRREEKEDLERWIRGKAERIEIVDAADSR